MKGLFLLTLFIALIVLAGCVQEKPTIVEEPTPQVTPSAPAVTEPEPITPSLPEKEQVDLNLVEMPLEKILLDVPLIYSGHSNQMAFPEIGSLAMLMNFERSDISLTEIIAASGLGLSGVYISERNLLVNGLEQNAIKNSAENLGFDYVLGGKKDSLFSNQEFAKDFSYSALKVEEFSDQSEAVNFLERVLSSNRPAMVYVDVYYLKKSLVSSSLVWEKFFASNEGMHKGHYFVVTGYDEINVYLNDPSQASLQQGKNMKITLQEFLDAWKNTAGKAMDERLGPYWMLFVKEKSSAKLPSEIILWNITVNGKVADQIRKAAVIPETDALIHCGEFALARKEFAVYLIKYTESDPANYFRQSGIIFTGLCDSVNKELDLEKIADKEEEGLKALSS